MSLVTVPQVKSNDEVTALSVNQGPNSIAAVLNGNVDDSNISTLSGSKISSGTLPGTALATESNPYLRLSESVGDFVASGGVWSPLTGLNAGMNEATVYLAGQRKIIPAETTHAFTASRDTYVSIDSTGALAYQEVSNNATAPTFAAGSLQLSVVITNGTTVTSARDMRIMGNTGVTRTFLPLLTGFSGTPTVNLASFTRIGKLVYLDFDFSGTSNATTLTFTLPVPPRYSNRIPAIVSDNGTFGTAPGLVRFTAGSRTAEIAKDFNGVMFTASGAKTAKAYGIVYEGL